MNDYDQASRAAARRHDPAGFIGWVVGGVKSPCFRAFHDPSPTVLPGGEERRGDGVFLLAPDDAAEPTFALVVEFQTENDKEMLERLLEYVAKLRRELRPRGIAVGAALINLTGVEQEAVLEMTLPGVAGIGLRLQVLLRTLRDEDAAATLAAIESGRVARCILSWIPLMRGAGEASIINQWKALALAEPDPILRSEYGIIAACFAGLTRHWTAWEKALEGWNMRESPFLNAIRQKERVEGRVEGKVEGREEGQIARIRVDLLRLIERRFKTPVPSDLLKAIQSNTNVSEIEQWMDAILDVTTLEDYRALIKR